MLEKPSALLFHLCREVCLSLEMRVGTAQGGGQPLLWEKSVGRWAAFKNL